MAKINSKINTRSPDFLENAEHMQLQVDDLKEKLDHIINAKNNLEPKDVVLFGFGRVGRLIARELISQAGKGQQLRLRAIVTRSSSDKDIINRVKKKNE